MYIPTTVLTTGKDAEVAYAEITANASITATTEGTANTVVTAPAIIADGTSAYVIQFYARGIIADTALDRTLDVLLYQDGASIGFMQHASTLVAGKANEFPGQGWRRIVPTIGSHTYSIRAFVSAGTGTIVASTGVIGGTEPAFIRITKAT